MDKKQNVQTGILYLWLYGIVPRYIHNPQKILSDAMFKLLDF